MDLRSGPTSQNPSSSVIVPTFRRPDDVVRCVKSLLEQSAGQFEIVVVDNAGDHDLDKELSALDQARIPVSYVFEPSRGLHNARHAGARSARSTLLLFTDDDATFDRGWVEAYEYAFAANPAMAAAGGPVRPRFEIEPPTWLTELLRRGRDFGALSLMEPFDSFTLNDQCYFYGVNMAVRADSLFSVGGFNPDSVGMTRIGDGEIGLLRKLRTRGASIGYVPDALVYHHIPRRRMTVDYLLSRATSQGRMNAFSRYWPNAPNRVTLLRDLIRETPSYAKLSIGVPLRHGRQIDPVALSRRYRRAEVIGEAKAIARLLFDKEARRIVQTRDWGLSSTGAHVTASGQSSNKPPEPRRQ